tara:strand:- start:1088 stop:1234 length:147 start_codon:yes stop_codon:yes gene_type:complete
MERLVGCFVCMLACLALLALCALGGLASTPLALFIIILAIINPNINQT